MSDEQLTHEQFLKEYRELSAELIELGGTPPPLPKPVDDLSKLNSIDYAHKRDQFFRYQKQQRQAAQLAERQEFINGGRKKTDQEINAERLGKLTEEQLRAEDNKLLKTFRR